MFRQSAFEFSLYIGVTSLGWDFILGTLTEKDRNPFVADFREAETD